MSNSTTIPQKMSTTMAKQMKRPPPEPLGILRGHGAPVNSSSFLTATMIVSGAADGQVKLWSLKTRREMATYAAHSKAGVLYTAALDERRIVTQGRDGYVKVWDVNTFGGEQGSEPLQTYYCGSFSFTKFATLRWNATTATEEENTSQQNTVEHQNLIVCPGGDAEKILVYDTRTSGSIPALKITAMDKNHKKGMCMSLSLFLSSGVAAQDSGSALQTYIAAGYEGGQLSILDFRTGGKIACEAQISKETNPLLAFDITHDGRSAICGSSAEDICIATFDAHTLSITSKAFFTCNHGGISAVRIRPDQRIFATAGWDHRVRVFHLRKLKPLAILKYHTESVFGLDFSADSSLLVSSSKDQKIALWSIYPPSEDAVKQSLRGY